MLKRGFRRQAYYCASAAFLMVYLIGTAAIFFQPYIGLDLEKVKGQWVVTYADPQHVFKYSEKYKWFS